MTKTKLDMITKLKDISQDITTSERKLKVSSRKENAIPKEQPYSYEQWVLESFSQTHGVTKEKQQENSK